jgi:cysteine sulfinate desulfinase/cysteine desulfurase-like protein
VLEGIRAIEPGRASLRFSFSRFTTKAEIDYAVDRIAHVFNGGKIAPIVEQERVNAGK